MYTCNKENLKPLISIICSDSTKLAVSPSRLAPLLHIRVPGIGNSNMSIKQAFNWNFPTALVTKIKTHLDDVYSAWKLTISRKENSSAVAQQLGSLTVG